MHYLWFFIALVIGLSIFVYFLSFYLRIKSFLWQCIVYLGFFSYVYITVFHWYLWFYQDYFNQIITNESLLYIDNPTTFFLQLTAFAFWISNVLFFLYFIYFIFYYSKNAWTQTQHRVYNYFFVLFCCYLPLFFWIFVKNVLPSIWVFEWELQELFPDKMITYQPNFDFLFSSAFESFFEFTVVALFFIAPSIFMLFGRIFIFIFFPMRIIFSIAFALFFFLFSNWFFGAGYSIFFIFFAFILIEVQFFIILFFMNIKCFTPLFFR